ncbi:replication protein RepA [Niveispirillum fermenti]|uniref:replication protein RepA n=1 Tax=Niveispirillum fermenti TaxID=1233113 RepID=UPI003A8C81B0
MAQIHHLITAQGIDFARQVTQDKAERQAVDTAFAVLSDADQRIGIMHAGFAMTALPHRQIPDLTWVRQTGDVKLVVESGRDADQAPVGIPYGSIARMILLYLQTEAVKTRSRDIPLGRSMNQWLANLGVDSGGRQYQLAREQSKRLSLCRLTFFRAGAAGTMVSNGSFVRDAILPSSRADDDQLTLWRESVRLDEGFYDSLMQHPMPVREAAIREIGSRSMAIDIYIWLAYRLHVLDRPTPISWAALYAQFGGGFAQIRQFRAKFREPLTLALAAYPEARVSIDDAGVILYPSDPAVPYARMAAIR